MSGIHEEHIKSGVARRRIIVVMCIQLFFFFILVARLFFLQIVNYNKYRNMSEDNRIKTFLIPPLRGNILDRNGLRLTENKKNYRVLLYKSRGGNLDSVGGVSRVLNLSEYDEKRMLTRVQRNRDKQVISVLDNLNWEDLVKVEGNSYNLEGVVIENGFIRYYPYSSTFAHIIGYVNSPIKEEIDREKNPKMKELLLHPDYKIGRSGLERSFNTRVTGKYGYKKVEMNALSIPLREIYLEPSTEGRDIRLTIDYDLQKFVEDKLADSSGTAVVMNVKTGEILAMVSSPSFDANSFVEGVSSTYWNELNTNPDKPLNNKAITAMYPPGSTFKLMVAISALENGWNPKTNVSCSGKVALNKERVLHCWNSRGHGDLDMNDAIKYSCNIYFARLGLYAGMDNIYKTATDFGFGEKYDINLQHKKTGLIPNREWKKRVLNDVWVSGDTVNASLGQGFLSVTPLELVVMTARIANGGYPIRPYLISNSPSIDYNKNLFLGNPIVSPSTIDIVKLGMYRVINEKGGTAYWARIKNSNMEMSGKTGTAQVIAKDKKESMEESNDEIEKRFRNHGLFVAFAPFEEPKYAIVVVIEHGKSGSGAAAPVARDILLYAQKNNIGFNEN